MDKVVGVLVSFNPEVGIFPDVIGSISSQLFKLIIVDNGSSNVDSIKNICGRFVNVEILALDSNIGLASAQNSGVSVALACSASHIIFFDQDSIISSGMIDALLSAESEIISSGEKLAAIGPSFFDPETKDEYPVSRYFGPFISRTPVFDFPVKADFIIASGSMFRVEIFDIVGLMKDDLFIDYIDVEWCLRAKSLGYSVFVAPKAKMSHTIGDKRFSLFGRKVSVHSPLRRYYLVRNSFFMVSMPHIPFGYKLREVVFNILRAFVSLFLAKKKVDVLKYIYYGLVDGLKKKGGKFCHK